MQKCATRHKIGSAKILLWLFYIVFCVYCLFLKKPQPFHKPNIHPGQRWSLKGHTGVASYMTGPRMGGSGTPTFLPSIPIMEPACKPYDTYPAPTPLRRSLTTLPWRLSAYYGSSRVEPCPNHARTAIGSEQAPRAGQHQSTACVCRRKERPLHAIFQQRLAYVESQQLSRIQSSESWLLRLHNRHIMVFTNSRHCLQEQWHIIN